MKRKGKATKPSLSRSGTAAKVRLEPVFEGFWVVVRAAKFRQQDAAAQALADSLPIAKAQVVALRADAKSVSAPREFVLSAKSPGKEPISNAQAWEGARTLMKSPWVIEAEPLFATPGLEPNPRQTSVLLAPYERRRAAKSGGSKVPLGCAATNSIWHLEMIKAPEAWLFQPAPGGQQFGEGIVIGHPDTGYTQHQEIWEATPSARRLVPSLGYNFEEGLASPLDPMDGSNPGHGTATASVIMSGAGGPATPFVTGSAPVSRLVPIRVSDSVIHFSFKNATQSIYHAVDKAGAHIISMSLGGPLRSSAFKVAIDYAISKGVIVMAAAGNVWPFVVYPARFNEVIAVAACNCDRKPWKDSASGGDVDITAPGESVWRAQAKARNGSLAFTVAPSSGTSYAVSTLAGACATWLAFHGRTNLLNRYGAGRLAAVFKQVLTTGGFAAPTGWDKGNYGVGILDVRALLSTPLPPVSKAAKGKKAQPSAAAPTSTAEIADQIAGYFPDAQRQKVKRAVKEMVPGPTPTRAKKRADASLAAEFAFHVATNAKVRAALHKQALVPAKKAVKKAAKSATKKATASTVLSAMKSPSPSLQAKLANAR